MLSPLGAVALGADPPLEAAVAGADVGPPSETAVAGADVLLTLTVSSLEDTAEASDNLSESGTAPM